MKRMFNVRVASLLVCLLLLSLVLPGFTYAQGSNKETVIEKVKGIQKIDKEVLEIVSDGTSNYTICIPDNPTNVEETAANELKNYIQKATGVELSIVNEKNAGAYTIMIGATKFAKENNVIVKGEEEWIIKGFNHRLVLTGGKTRGVLYSVYHFLEDIVGVRWWSYYEEDVPKLASIKVAEDFESSGTPAFEYRDIYDLHSVNKEDNSLFFVRNRMNGGYVNTEGAFFCNTPAEYGGDLYFAPPKGAHTFNLYFPASEYFVEHPEWYALNPDGVTHDPNGQLCMTNEELKQAFLAKVLKNIEDSYAAADAAGCPRPTYIAIDQNDALGGCQCSKCKASVDVSGASGHLLKFVNWMAGEVAKTYPEIKIKTLAYWFYVDVPKDDTKPADNVVVRLADSNTDILHDLNNPNNSSVKSRISAWSNICTNNNLYIWKYAVNYGINPVFPTMFTYGNDFKEYYNNGVKGVFVENEGSIATDMFDMKEWMMAKLMEDPNQDDVALMESFCHGYYGAAGDKVLEFLRLADTDARNSSMSVQFGTDIYYFNWVSVNTALTGNRLFEEALELVKDDETLSARVRLARSSLDKTIARRFTELKNTAENSGITGFNLNKSESAQRVVDCLNEQLALKCHEAGDHSTHTNYSCVEALKQIAVFEKLAQEVDVESPLPAELEGIPSEAITDFTPEMFRLYTSGQGLSIVKDEGSLVGNAAKITLADVDTASKQYYTITDTLPLLIGIYNPTTGTFGSAIHVGPADIITDKYMLIKLGDTKIPSGAYLYVFESWVVQQDLYSALSGDPNQLYDIYVSMKFEGAAYGGDSSKPDAIYVDRIIVVDKGLIPVV